MISLWILAVLVIFAVGIGYRSAINLKLARNQLERLKANYLASGGVKRAMLSKEFNSTFEQKWDDGGYLKFELTDEESKLNINGTGYFDREKLLNLFRVVGIEEKQALGLKEKTIAWIIAKKEPLTNPQELLLIFESYYNFLKIADYRQRASEIFEKIKDLITVYGLSSTVVNLNTASLTVLEVIFKTASSSQEDTKIGDAIPDLLSAIDSYRKSGKIFTIDVDQIKEALGLQGQDNNQTLLIDTSIPYLTAVSENVRIKVKAGFKNTFKQILVIYYRPAKKILYWHEN